MQPKSTIGVYATSSVVIDRKEWVVDWKEEACEDEFSKMALKAAVRKIKAQKEAEYRGQ
jgi:hypothetical protein